MPKAPRRSSTAFAIVLFTDMVGSTAIASELGDRRWKVLQAKHHSVIRARLREHGGREIDTAGDGFFATFAEGEAAIRCTCAIRDAVMEIGLQVRCGLNVGQVEVNDGKPTGAAVVAAARIMAKAGDGEVLVSNLLRELLPGSTIEFADAGTHDLKGLEGAWHLFRVVAVDGPPLLAAPPAEELAVRRTSIVDSTAAQPLSRSKKILAGVAAFLVLAAGITFLRSRDDPGVSTIAPNSIGVLDPESGEVKATVELAERPGAIAVSGNAVWVANPDAGTVSRIDPDGHALVDTIPVGENPTGIAVGFDGVWVVESGGPSVSRISPGTDEVVKTISVGNGPSGIAVGEDAVWVTNRFDGTISRIDPDTNDVIEEIPVGLDPGGIVVGFGYLWVALAGSNQVVSVDPDTSSVTQQIGVGDAPVSLAVSEDAVLVVNTLDDTVSQIDPATNSVVDTAQVGEGPSGITVVHGHVWVANEADGTLSRIESGENSAPIVVKSAPQELADVNGELWVSVRGAATSHLGGTLKTLSRNGVSSLDPSAAWDVWSWRAVHLIGDGLVAFEPVGGANPRLLPDLATSIPTPTDDGTTYTFTLRPEIRYSNGEVVAAVDFRRALERGFPLSKYAHRYFYGGLIGGEACRKEPRTCDLSEGIETDEVSGTVAFHLTEPDPEFLYKLTLPFAYPVPPSVPDEEQATSGIPGTGPYMLLGPMTDQGLTLVRNPKFRIWSPAARPDGYVNRIEWAFGVRANTQVDAVATGNADLAMEPEESERFGDLFVTNPEQVHVTSQPLTIYAVLDTKAPPFDDIGARQAINLAVDRDRIVEILGGQQVAFPTCQQLPPNFPGYEPYCPYTVDPAPNGEGSWTGRDLEDAKRLVRRSGTAGTTVTIEMADWFPQGQIDLLGDYMIELLDELGYEGSMISDPQGFLDARTEFNIAIDAWVADYPAASNFINPFLRCDSNYVPSAGFCDRRIDQMIDRATELQLADPVTAGELWAQIDRAIVDQAPYLWLVSSPGTGFTSERVGNYQWSQQWGQLLDQIWVR